MSGSLAPVTDRDRGPDLSATDDEAALERARTVATLLDDAVRVPMTPYRVGLDPILGILPVSGDLVAAVASLYIVVTAVRVGVPTRSVLWMLARIGGDFVVGSIPILGTLIDAVWKSNKRNVETIEAHVHASD